MSSRDEGPARSSESTRSGTPRGMTDGARATTSAGKMPATTSAESAAPKPDGSAPPETGDPFGVLHARPGPATPWPPRPGQRGLSAPYPPGGIDPDPRAGRIEERRYLRLLIAMVLVIVGSGLALTILGFLLGFAGVNAAR